MKIKTIDCFTVQIPYDDDQPHIGSLSVQRADMTAYPPIWRTMPVDVGGVQSVMVRITTDSGVTGWGETPSAVPDAIRNIIETLFVPLLHDADPRDIHVLWEKMLATSRSAGFTGGYQLAAISAVDMALWDAVGKAVHAPVATLLGGQIRDKIGVHASALPAVPPNKPDALNALLQRARSLVERGFQAIKVTIGTQPDHDRAVLQALREALPDTKLAVAADFAGDYALARRAGNYMGEYDILWYENPLPPDNMTDYSALAVGLDVPVAAGASLHNRWQFNAHFAAAAVDVVQPFVARAGGISECRRIAMLADTYGLPVAPGLAAGTAVQFAAATQLAVAAQNLLSLELPLDTTLAMDGILNTPLHITDGMLHATSAPGLGLDLNVDALLKYAI